MADIDVIKIGDNTYTRVSKSKTTLANIPGYATWTQAEMEAYIEANVVDLASAKTVLVGLATMFVLMRNNLWPDLEGSV